MTVTCEIIETNIQNIAVYGLMFIGAGGEAVCRVEDITVDREKLAVLRANINETGIDALHIMNVLEDALVMWEAEDDKN